MKIGLQIPIFTWPNGAEKMGSTLKDIAQTADESGFASIWVMDHLFQIEKAGRGLVDDPMLESYSTLGFIAAATQNIKLGTMVTSVNYRAPGFLVKTVSSLDVLSGGRTWLGVGAGWYEREAVGLGLPFSNRKERFERLEETLQIAKQMWANDVSPYEGKHYHLAEPINQPQPLAKPHPPILVGGSGEKKTLRLVAQYADACNLFSLAGHDVIAHKLTVLQQHCDEVGRDYNEIERTLLAPLTEVNVPELIQNCQAWAELGIQHVIFTNIPDIHTITPVETIGREIIPAVAEL